MTKRTGSRSGGGPSVVVGLTGGIASGKSAVAEMLRELGAVIVDADVLARDVVAPGTEGLDAVVRRFSPAVLAPDGSLNRAALSAIVFADPEARRDLEAIIHPAVRARAAELTAAATGQVVVQVIPLLVETGQAGAFDLVVVVDVAPDEQVRRLRTRDGLDPEQAAQRLAAQVSRAERIAAADVVIDNSGSLAELRSQVDTLWRRLSDPRFGHS